MRALLAIMLLLIGGTALSQDLVGTTVRSSPFDNASVTSEFLPVEEAYHLTAELQTVFPSS
jgi:hypothetical protein